MASSMCGSDHVKSTKISVSCPTVKHGGGNVMV